MKTKLFFKLTLQLSAVLIIFVIVELTGCSKDNSNSKPAGNQTQADEKQDSKDMTLVRDKGVNIDSLDQNKDGNLYQCQMDYDVISDKPGTCPKCGMKLEKVSVENAKKNFESFINN